jgi:hypothetical protein
MEEAYQRRTPAGIGRQEKTVRMGTGKTPRMRAALMFAAPAVDLVRFFSIVRK